jgi:hypothetical protein
MARFPHLLILIAMMATLALPATAAADPDAVIRDCSVDGKLDGKYSKQDLRQALENLPSDLREYSDCAEIIGAGIGSGAGGNGSKANSAAARAAAAAAGGSELSSRAGDQEDLNRIAADHRRPDGIQIDGERVTPGSDGLFDAASASNGMPLPLLLALVGLGLLALAGGAVALRSRVPALARVSFRQRGPFSRKRR